MMSKDSELDIVASTTAAKKFKILLVDDSPFVRTQVRDVVLTQQATVLEAEDGIQALAVGEKHPDINLILCDINMPKMDGLAFLKILSERSTPGKPRIPVIMLTTENMLDKVVQGKKLGAVAWVIKPMSAPDIIRLIEKFKPA